MGEQDEPMTFREDLLKELSSPEAAYEHLKFVLEEGEKPDMLIAIQDVCEAHAQSLARFRERCKDAVRGCAPSGRGSAISEALWEQIHEIEKAISEVPL